MSVEVVREERIEIKSKGYELSGTTGTIAPDLGWWEGPSIRLNDSHGREYAMLIESIDDVIKGLKLAKKLWAR